MVLGHLQQAMTGALGWAGLVEQQARPLLGDIVGDAPVLRTIHLEAGHQSQGEAVGLAADRLVDAGEQADEH